MQKKFNKEYKSQKCRYYLQGRCRFGESCFYSHQGFIQAFMVRHAESEFNNASLKYPGRTFQQQPAIHQLQLNTNYIDCSITQSGSVECQLVKIPYEFSPIDVLFVSPLNRALQTAEILVRTKKVKVNKVIVLPQLTEVLSKICDFSCSFKEKRQKYKYFDFSQIDRFVKQSKLIEDQDSWQDLLVDKEYFRDILVKEKAGLRYMSILQNIFPTPLEDSKRCFERSMAALTIMKALSEKLKAKKVLIVSHNRILKYFDGRFSKGKAYSFVNLEMRKILF